MSEVRYIGEHLWIGQMGHALVVLAFVAALFSAYSYFQYNRSSEKSWLRLGRIGFTVHAFGTFVVIGLIFFMMMSKMYEYVYVYRSVSDDLPMRYLLAAFWEDQEGSFLLWMFWHIILGFVLIKNAGKWEAPVMTSLALIQTFITSMLLGLYLPFGDEDFKIGSNPFALIRDVFEGPIFVNADYLSLVTGQGLNPLLQNYWMTIHPPTLFLGFASLSIPFCFALAGLSTRRHKEVLSPILKWSLFSAFILGLGILMGGVWAYEALTFGGYWAWDPVENTSLVPWLILLAGMHTNLIAKNTGYSIKTTYIYYMVAFILALYSTFLTRSGVLGETSVHAFTTLGLETQLIALLAFFSILAVYKYVSNSASIPDKTNEESIVSREFWMFVGALVLFFSGILMTISTSLPIYNKMVRVFDPGFAGVVIDDAMHHHNKYQIWIGIFIGLLSGLSVLLRYRSGNWSGHRQKFLKTYGVTTVTALILTLGIQYSLNINAWQQYLFLFAGLFVIVSNIGYLTIYLKNNIKLAGSTLSHTGFGILILGIMYSGLNQKTISTNPFVQEDFFDEETANKAIYLIKNQPFFTSEYWINYEKDTLQGNLRIYQLNFKKVDKDNKVVDMFTTYPSAVYSTDFTKIAATNPGTEHKILYDVFTQIVPPLHLQDIEFAKQMEDSLKYLSHLVYPGFSFEEETYFATIDELLYNYPLEDGDHGSVDDFDLTIGVPLTITSKRSGKTHHIVPGLGLKDALIYQFPEVINELGIKIKVSQDLFNTVFTEDSALDYTTINLKEGESAAWRGYHVSLEGFNRSPKHKNYTREEGDIALAAKLKITERNSEESIFTEPIFIIRNAQQFSIKEYHPTTGIHARFTSIDPITETMTFKLAMDKRDNQDFEMFIASDVPRSDILVLEANIFPGINLVWLGCLMMLSGLLLSLYRKKGI